MPGQPPIHSPLRIAVLISGGGTTLANLIRRAEVGRLDVEFSLLISSNPQAGGLLLAKNASIPQQIVERKQFASTSEFSDTIFDLCRKTDVDLIVMGGFLKHVLVPSDFENRVMNIHPALIPSFCGGGYYGQHVHEAVLKSGVKVSGCTVHFVDNEYDHGPIILQRTVPVRDSDTPTDLAKRVFKEECDAYPTAITLYAERRLRVEDHRVIVEPV